MPKLSSYGNQSIDFKANQWTGFYMMATLTLNGETKQLIAAGFTEEKGEVEIWPKLFIRSEFSFFLPFYQDATNIVFIANVDKYFVCK